MRRKGKTIGFLPSLFLERCIIIVICRTKGWGNPSNSHRLVNLKPPVVPVGCHTSGCLSAAKASGGATPEQPVCFNASSCTQCCETGRIPLGHPVLRFLFLLFVVRFFFKVDSL